MSMFEVLLEFFDLYHDSEYKAKKEEEEKAAREPEPVTAE